jgi:hypothetical protein
MGEAGAAGRGGHFGLAFGGFGAPTIPVMTPIRSALTSRKFGASTSGWRGGVLSVTQYPARSVGHPGTVRSRDDDKKAFPTKRLGQPQSLASRILFRPERS